MLMTADKHSPEVLQDYLCTHQHLPYCVTLSGQLWHDWQDGQFNEAKVSHDQVVLPADN